MPALSTVVAAIALALVPGAVYLAVLNAIDRYEKEPWSFLLAGVGLGAVVAPAAVLVVLALAGRPASLPPAFAPGLRPDPVLAVIEEAVKGLCLVGLVVYVRDELDDVLDGIVYGAALGAGFGAAETFLYALGGTSLLTAGTVAALVVAGLSHAFYGAVVGAILGASQRLGRLERATVAMLAIATAAFFHAFHDTLPAILARVFGEPAAAAGFLSRLTANAVNWLGMATVAAAIVLTWRREARILRAELHDEVAHGVVSRADFATITSFGGRLRRETTLLRRGGIKAVLEMRRLYAAEGELAFHKWRATVRRQPPSPERGDELRRLIRELSDAVGEADR